MNLLPKDQKDFSSKEYWNEFFSKQKSGHFEWYGEYDSLNEVLDKYIYVKDKVLVIGCGNSKLSADLYDVGICNTISIDISEPVITQMIRKYGKDRPQMRFEKMDVFDMSYENESFSAVLDKGTLDALMVDESSSTDKKINNMFSEIGRILRYGGRYICISLLQEHILKKLLDWFLENNWLVRIHRSLKAETSFNGSVAFPVFVCIFTKMKKIANAPMILELVHDSSKPKRCSSKEEIIEYAKSVQHYAFLKYYLNKKKMPDDDICLELYDSNTEEVKYRLFVVDRKETSSIEFAVFIVPEGREVEWLFSTPEGRKQLAASANCERLIVVHLLRNKMYNNLEDVKIELSGKVLELAPQSCNSQIPILSLGDDVGHRDVQYTGKSKISGDYVVEDVASNDDTVFRRLIFLSNPYLVQSEVKLIKSIQKKKKKSIVKFEVDFNYLACDHHIAIISGLSFLSSKIYDPKVLIIGLGGGALTMFLYKNFPNACIEAIELDPSIVDIAKTWFSLASDERLVIKICDGLDHINAIASKASQFDVVILDADSKDPSLGISSPPLGFLETSMLETMCKIITNSGILILNFSCRNAELRTVSFAKLKSVFKTVYTQNIPSQVNEVIYCMKDKQTDDFHEKLKENYIKLKEFVNEQSRSNNVFSSTDLLDCIKEM